MATTARTLVHAPVSVRAGQPFEVRALIGHAMETGHRLGSDGQRLPRNVLRRFECRNGQELVFAADLHAAIAANPYLGFWLSLNASATLTLRWMGDGGFDATAQATIAVV